MIREKVSILKIIERFLPVYTKTLRMAGLTFKCYHDEDLFPPSILKKLWAPTFTGSPYANPDTDKQNEVSVYKCVGK